MNVLVLGVTGHIGNAIARELVARGHKVTGVSRRGRARPNLRGLKLRYIQADIETTSNLGSWVRAHDAVVDAAAPYPLTLPDLGMSNAGRVLQDARRRSERLLHAIRKHNVPFAYVSTFGTLSQSRTDLDRIAAAMIERLHPYFAVKHQIESDAREAAREGYPVAIVNPTGCLGPWDCKDRRRCFVPALLGGEMPGSTDQMLNVIDVRDVAAGLVCALERKRYGEPIPLAGHNISNEGLFRWICEIGGIQPPRLVGSSVATVVATYLAELSLRAIRVATPLPALVAMLTFMHGYLAPSPAQVELGVVLRPLSATLLDTISWYRSIGYC
jgi:dihydroflavonol-4-reductase